MHEYDRLCTGVCGRRRRGRSLEKLRVSRIPCNANESAMNKLMAHAGTLRDMGDRFVRAWKRAWTGEVFEEWHVTFFTSEELTAAFTPKRREMRRRRHGNVRKAKRSDTGYDRDLAVRVRYTAHSNTLSRANHEYQGEG
jgi:hypothetical protein